MEIKSTNDIKLMKINALLYGRSGYGKTHTAMTLNGKVLVIGVDPGLLTLSGVKIDSTSPTTWEEVEHVKDELQKPENKTKYDTIFIDGITAINELCKVDILNNANSNDNNQETLHLKDWGVLQTRMTRLINSFIRMPYNIIFTALEDVHKDEKTGYETVCPSLNGKLPLNMPGYFDFVFRLVMKKDNGEDKRYFLTSSTEKSLAKDRTRKLESLEDPNWTNIIKKIKGGK